jgi:hypothetical protein
MGQLLFAVIALGIALLGLALLAWLVDQEHKHEHDHQPHTQHPHAGKHPARRN